MPRMTEAEKEQRKHDRKAKSMNAAALKLVGGPNSLFRDMAETYTRDDAYWHWRRAKAGENNIYAGQVLAGFELLTLTCIRRRAAELIGESWASQMWERCHRVYSTNYMCHYGDWRQMLCTTERIVLQLERRTDPARANKWFPDGEYVAETVVWPIEGYQPVMTGDEFSAALPWFRSFKYAKLVESDDDPTGLFEQVMSKLQQRGAIDEVRPG